MVRENVIKLLTLSSIIILMKIILNKNILGETIYNETLYKRFSVKKIFNGVKSWNKVVRIFFYNLLCGLLGIT